MIPLWIDCAMSGAAFAAAVPAHFAFAAICALVASHAGQRLQSRFRGRRFVFVALGFPAVIKILAGRFCQIALNRRNAFRIAVKDIARQTVHGAGGGSQAESRFRGASIKIAVRAFTPLVHGPPFIEAKSLFISAAVVFANPAHSAFGIDHASFGASVRERAFSPRKSRKKGQNHKAHDVQAQISHVFDLN